MNHSRYIIIAVLLSFFIITHPLYAQVISTITGPGNKIYSSDGKIDILPTITNPNGVAVDDSGNVYVAEYWDATDLLGSIFKFNPFDTSNMHKGIITKGENIPPRPGHIFYPHGIAIDHAGNMYVAEYSGHVVLKITPEGKVLAFAGCGVPGYSGDHGNAAAAKLSLLNGIAADRTGNIYIADELNYAIRKVDADGIISTFAGTGEEGYSGDGDIASDAQINRPYGVAADDTGNVYFSDTYNNVIRRVSTQGIISTVAGNGKEGYGGDGGQATAARLNKPAGIALDNSGNLYVADEGNNVVRKIAANGLITTIAGNGRKGYQGDIRPAAFAELSGPRDVAVDHNGNMYIADFGNHVIRKVVIPLPFIPPSRANIPLLVIIPATFTVKHPFIPQSMVAIPRFVTSAPSEKIPLLPATALSVTIPPEIISPSLVSIPVFAASTPLVKIPLLPATAFPVTILPEITSPPLATVPVFAASTPSVKIPLLPARAFPYVIHPAFIPHPIITIPAFIAIMPLVKILLLPVTAFPVQISLSYTPELLVTVPDIIIADPTVIPLPQNAEDKVTVSINTDNIMTIRSDKGSYTSFTITNMRGAQITEQMIKGKQTETDVTMLQPGQYYINLKGVNETKTLRFVKQN